MVHSNLSQTPRSGARRLTRSWRSLCLLAPLLSTACRAVVLIGSPPPFPSMPPEARRELVVQCELAGEPAGPDGFRLGHPCPALSLWVRELARFDCALARQRGEDHPKGCDW